MPLKNRASRLFLYFALAACFAGWLNELASADDEIEDAVTDAVDEDDADPEVEDKAKKDEKPKPKKKELEKFKAPVIPDGYEDSVYLAESFDRRDTYEKRWIKSSAKKDGVDAAISKYDGEWSMEEPSTKLFIGDYGLVLKSRARHHAIAAKLNKAFEFKDKPLVVQYEVKFQQAMECGGAYVKLLSDLESLDLNSFHDHSQYTIMFGPDKCGEDKKIAGCSPENQDLICGEGLIIEVKFGSIKILHFIFQHKNPVSGKYSEKHAKKPTGNFQSVFEGKKTHLFTLVVHPNNKYEVFVDQESVSSGNLLEDFTPAVNPEKEIDDANDKKPEDWDEREKVPDPDAEKPDDWDEDAPAKILDPDAKKPDDWLDDEPELIPDPNSQKPEDWDTEEDGEWEAPQISNPKCEKAGCGEWKPPSIDNPNYKGKWSPPLIDNPNYKGIWKPRKIPNPDYFEDKHPFKMTAIGAVGLELWSMTPDILFDNFIITDSKHVADKFAEQTWVKKNVIETYGGRDDSSVISGLLDATNDRPWLWVLYVLVVVLPFGLIAACCFPGSKSDGATQKKKTDEVTADTVEQEEDKKEDEETKEDEAGAGEEETKEANDAEEKSEDADEGADEEETSEKKVRRRPRKDN